MHYENGLGFNSGKLGFDNGTLEKNKKIGSWHQANPCPFSTNSQIKISKI